jgi:uncharacterized protein YdaU (DUF1376 family)
LDYVARGLYRDLLDEQWCEGSIPSKIEELADICGCPVEVMSECWPSLKVFFEEQEDGSLVNSKLEKQRTDDDAVRAERARAGKAGALAKMKKTKERQANAKQLPELATICHIAEQSRADTEQSISEQDAEIFSEEDFENPDNGQGETMKLKDELTKIAAQYGAKAGGHKGTWDDVKALGIAHGTGAVARDFEEWIQENQGDDFPYGAISSYLKSAEDRLRSDSPLQASAKDPEVVSLVRELSYASGGLVCFLDKQRARLAEVLKEFTAEEIKSAFKTWVETQDLNDTKNLSYAPGKFVQIVDNLAYSARKQKQEAEKAKTLRDATALRLQEEAEIDRQAREKMKQADENIFDPLADLLSETDKAVI